MKITEWPRGKTKNKERKYLDDYDNYFRLQANQIFKSKFKTLKLKTKVFVVVSPRIQFQKKEENKMVKLF